MTDEELNETAKMMEWMMTDWVWAVPADGDWCAKAASAIRQLMRERDQAFEEGQRDMQLAAANMTNDPAIFAKIYDLQILTRPLKRF
jgi:hypothetical protein